MPPLINIFWPCASPNSGTQTSRRSSMHLGFGAGHPLDGYQRCDSAKHGRDSNERFVAGTPTALAGDVSRVYR